jgi:tRNA(fMet)-specific endonuclease VapC
MALTLLDTDILSELLKQKDPNVVRKAAVYLHLHGQFAFSALTRYEVVRGLLEKRATAQLSKFTLFCQQSLVLPLTDAVLDRAADLWATAGRLGRPRSDADLLIAATALENGRALATGNHPHFQWIPGLVIDDWRQP